MFLLGRLNWWIPPWLDRLLPHLEPEGPPAVPTADTTRAPVLTEQAPA
jgi:RND superfamily putative drug exporter